MCMKTEEAIKKEVKELENEIIERTQKNPMVVQLPLRYRLKTLRWVLE